MARDDWFRNADWNAAIERAFFEKLRRAKNKAQYLRIQAGTLTHKHPEVALRLLDEYFKLGDHFDDAQAHVDRASAYLSHGDMAQAVKAYETALAVEDQRPNVKTQAYLDLPFLIASLDIHSHHEQALHLLQQHKSRLMFPVDHFRWHAAHALISYARGRTSSAREHAQLALDAAGMDHSGFRYHPSAGLVGNRYESVRLRLSAVVA
jgi:tetratricopeptide (TPR) repeat protein